MSTHSHPHADREAEVKQRRSCGRSLISQTQRDMALTLKKTVHLTLEQLNDQTNNFYLSRISPENPFFVPAYPRPELHVSHVSHSTDLTGLQGISADRGSEASQIQTTETAA
ncbi:hypothetical protein WMY93_007943 [Mugilogobius chulae]|uniref:Uncharacterized protein n=1 Tax=Mugilogobius chulae TaxID=88201 RepID=A0AAW0PN95_9GOBI